MLDLSKTKVVKQGVLLDKEGDEFTVLIVERELPPLKTRKAQTAQVGAMCYFAWCDSPARPDVFRTGWGPFPSLDDAMETIQNEYVILHWDD